MKELIFIDTEVSSKGKLVDIGSLKSSGEELHSSNTSDFAKFVKKGYYFVGHNIIAHDSKYIGQYLKDKNPRYIDTLLLSPLLFPKKPYHNLLKDDKLVSNDFNNPLNDCKKCRDLFYEEINAFDSLTPSLKNIYGTLLEKTKEFRSFFEYVKWDKKKYLADYIRDSFSTLICANSSIENYINKYPVELAYSLAIIGVADKESLTPKWIHFTYPKVEEIIHNLCGKPCGKCNYCKNKFDSRKRLKEIFNYDNFRSYEGEPLQESAVNAAIKGESLLAIFPTGGGKSLTFQLPALIAGDAEKALTVVISPLQSLMKDQVDNLNDRGLVDAVTINGLLNPIERAQAIESLYDGNASILYISPESLRSKTIEKVLMSRSIARFVIDEAHCFSSWGQDFRVDYLYIAKFIDNICKQKQLDYIPVSCFTATAKQKVVSDICDYFKNNLGITLKLFTTKATRKNLHYRVIPKTTTEEKYQYLRDLLLEKDVPTIVYVSSTKLTEELAERLTRDGFPALPFHGKMDSDIKVENQNRFKSNEIKIIVATSAFGMGVDKSDVGRVVHFEISNSLENYVQEAGRAGRDENIEADCFILFCEDDLDKHFTMLNQTKLNINEIQQIWTAIKNLTKNRKSLSISPLELARFAGWDDEIRDIETRVRTAISALENAGYIERGMNSPRVFATGILARSVIEARKTIEKSPLFAKEDIEDAVRIISSLIGKKSVYITTNEAAESRVDYLADLLGIEKYRVIKLINLMREAKILADSKDMTAYVSKADNSSKTSTVFEKFIKLEKYIASKLDNKNTILDLRELNDEAIKNDIKSSTLKNIKTILSYWTIKGYINKNINSYKDNYSVELLIEKDSLIKNIENREAIGDYVIKFLYGKTRTSKDEEMVEFSMLELCDNYSSSSIFKLEQKIDSSSVEDALLYLSKIHALTIEGGFLVCYNAMQIERIELNNSIKYKKDDYKNLMDYYNLKVQQIHIVGEYANMMIKDINEAATYVSDYFNLEYDGFIKKYFKGNKKGEIQKNITPAKYNKLFGELSPIQKKIIDDDSQYISVIAGPGSGKTRVLVHKLASLLLLEDVKSEQLLMLTFSRAAATEFKTRLYNLIGAPAMYVDIKTFHSYCFELLGMLGDEKEFDKVVSSAVVHINNGEVEYSKITKTVLVIDEAQDMSQHEYNLLVSLIRKNEDMRVIAVGDDDQNIYEFRGSSSEYLASYTKDYNAKKYEMLENYRSVKKIIDFTNSFAKKINNRMKENEVKFVRVDNGFLKVTKYLSENMEEPVVDEYIKNKNYGGNTAFLTETNDEALKVLGTLLRKGVNARLIQSNDGFNLFNLVEIRTFISYLDKKTDSPIVSPNDWNNAKAALNEKYKNSSCIDLINKIFLTYELISKSYYKSDFIEYIKESNLEDFIDYGKEKVIVSTIHKAKGKEFDNVYIILKNMNMKDEEYKRSLYVGFTRAKTNLYINVNSLYLDKCFNPYGTDEKEYSSPETLCWQLSHKDTVLNFFMNKKKEIFGYIPGMKLILNDCYLKLENGYSVVKFSQAFSQKIQQIYDMGYAFDKANIRFIVAWYNKEDEKEYPIILPDIYFRKVENKVNNDIVENSVLDSTTEYIEPVTEELVIDDKEFVIKDLKEYRKKKAEELKVLPYYIFNDKTLENLINDYPATEEQLLEVNGFGPAKVEAYGEDILNILRKHKINKK